jgi:hypothetical protein
MVVAVFAAAVLVASSVLAKAFSQARWGSHPVGPGTGSCAVVFVAVVVLVGFLGVELESESDFNP